uniref:non-specific serine/threonine protein kinase n=1 Tax=Lactuca sativa TaxID=4236 RepID=A0A9R1XTA7_LACSA|nr:hypothetical protein LSAT_V11C200065770 [Lactuca sativa]
MSSSRLELEKRRIPLAEIIRATKHFSSEKLIGDGGFDMVYSGQLSEQWKNRLVAIKRLNPNGCQGDVEFNNEVKMVSNFNHPNIIPFVGYYDDANEKIVVYKNLDHHLQGKNKRLHLTWEQRLKICLGAARGIKYLHFGVGEHRRVIHRDVKSANILLDDNMEAKICDFGLSRLSPRNQPDTHVRTRAAGTWFYMDPIYNERGMLSKESDIYSFGVVMFEMSSGILAYNTRHFKDTKQQSLIHIVRSYYDDNKFVDGVDKLIDSAIKGQIKMSSFHKFNDIAHECINFDIKKRPTRDRIIEAIQEALRIQVGHLAFIYVVICVGSRRGLDVHGNSSITFGRRKMETKNVYLQRPKARETWEENYVFPYRRMDGWMEIKLGEFEYKQGDYGEVEMAFKEVKCWKTGVIVEGMEIRTK